MSEEEDGIIIRPSQGLHGADIKGYKDHRIIMAFSILSTKIDGIRIDDTKHVSVTFPSFFTLLDKVMKVVQK